MTATVPTQSKITYTSANVDWDSFHREFDDALARIRAQLGRDYPLYIGRDAVPSGGPPIVDASPIDSSVMLGRFATATPEQVGRAVAAAKAAQRDWAHRPWRERVAVLRKAASLIRERKFELAAIMSLEVGKSRLESMGDAEESADLIDYYCHELEDTNGFVRQMAKVTAVERNTDVLRPYGVFACIAPFNFPLALSTGMSAAALDFDGETVGRCHERARPESEPSDRKTGIIVHAVDLFDAEAIHEAVLDHGFAAGTSLFRGLEDHDRRAGKIARLGEIAGGPEQHRRMAIVAAGMHLARYSRSIWETGRLLDRQCIHVGAQSDDPAAVVRLAATDHPHHAGAADAGHHLVAAETFQLLGDGSGGAMHVIEELRMGVDVVPPGGDLAVQVGNAVDDRHQISSSHGGSASAPA